MKNKESMWFLNMITRRNRGEASTTWNATTLGYPLTFSPNPLEPDEREISRLIFRGEEAQFFFARPITKKPTFLRLWNSFEYEIQSWKYSIPLFFTTQGFDTFHNWEISSKKIENHKGPLCKSKNFLSLIIIVPPNSDRWKEINHYFFLRLDLNLRPYGVMFPNTLHRKLSDRPFGSKEFSEAFFLMQASCCGWIVKELKNLVSWKPNVLSSISF